MPSLNHIIFRASQIANSGAGDIKELAYLIHELARECRAIEKKAKDAEEVARRAIRK